MVEKTEKKSVEENKEIVEVEEKTEAVSEKKKTEGKATRKTREIVKEKTEEKKAEVGKDEEKPKDSSSQTIASKKKAKKADKIEKKVELEREYVIPLRKEIMKVPAYKRAKKAIRAMKEFLAKHMRVENRDLRRVKIDMYLNNEVWFRGIKKPLTKVKVIAKKIGGVVYAELADVPDVVKYAKARHEKRKLSGKKLPSKGKDRLEREEPGEDKDKDGVADKVEEDENRKSGAIKEAQEQKAAAKDLKHTKGGAHKAKTAPVRKTLR